MYNNNEITLNSIQTSNSLYEEFHHSKKLL